MTHLRQAWAVPSRPRPIVIIGAGGVVRTAHLPVYQRLEVSRCGPLRHQSGRIARDRETLRRVDRVLVARRGGGRGGRDLRPRRARRSDCRRVEGAAARRGGADSEADGRRSRRGAIDRRHLPRARPCRGDEFSAAFQPERAGASRSAGRAASSATSSTSKCGSS